MFKNISKKIRIAAIVALIIGCLAAIIYAGLLFSYGFYLYGALILIGGCGLFFLLAFVLFGFSELIENTAAIARNTGKLAEKNETNQEE